METLKSSRDIIEVKLRARHKARDAAEILKSFGRRWRLCYDPERDCYWIQSVKPNHEIIRKFEPDYFIIEKVYDEDFRGDA